MREEGHMCFWPATAEQRPGVGMLKQKARRKHWRRRLAQVPEWVGLLEIFGFFW